MQVPALCAIQFGIAFEDLDSMTAPRPALGGGEAGEAASGNEDVQRCGHVLSAIS